MSVSLDLLRLEVEKGTMKNFVQEKLKKNFPKAEVQISGDDHHVVLHIKDQAFNGLSNVQQHRLIYKTLGNVVGNELHALSLKVEGI